MKNETAHQGVTPERYREAMSRYAGHVQIVTAEHEGTLRGVTVTAACSVSDNPATVLFCVAKSNPLNRIFVEAGAFALNTLSGRHRDLADIFSGLVPMDGNERFNHGEWGVMTTGAPTLVEAAAVYDCELIEARELATHFILLGRVVDLALGEEGSALIYRDRAYHTLD